MKKRTKLVALLMGMVLAMGSMTACGGSDDTSSTDTSGTENTGSESTGTESTETGETTETQSIKLTVWAPQEEQKDYSDKDEKYAGYDHGLVEYMCEAFDEAHPEWDIEFEFKVCGENDAYTELSKDAAAGGDVFMYAGDQVASLVADGIVNPLAGTEDVAANNAERAMQCATVTDADGNAMVYGIPFTPNTWFMYYDSSKYSEDEVSSLDTMMAKDLKDCQYNFAMQIGNGWYNGGFFYANGCTVFGPDGKDESVCDFNGENGLAAAEAMLSLATNKKFLQDDDKGIGKANMKEGNLAALCSGTWDATEIQGYLGDNYAAAKLPTMKMGGKEVQLNSIGDYKYIGVNANTENPAAAQALAIWLGSEECQKDRFVARGVSPTWATLAEDETVKADVATVAQSNQLPYVAITPTSKKFTNNYWNAMGALGNGMVNGDVNEKNLQKQLDSLVDNIVNGITE